MNPKRILDLRKVVTISICWTFVGILFFLEDYSFLRSNQLLEYYQGDLKLTLIIRNILAPFLAGLIGGGLLIFVVRHRIQQKSYGMAILQVILYYLLIYSLILVVATLIFESIRQSTPVWSGVVWANSMEYLADAGQLRGVARWLVVVAGTQFILSISDKFGPGILWALIRGKYRKPRKEERIFMFLDLKSSTTIAEKLGNDQYNRLLNDFFSDITTPIIEFGGEIYQYVGDEVIISWSLDRGLRHANCLRCFFGIEKVVFQKKSFYQSTYGLIPEFKAGIHGGQVTVGEVGIIKRDISYSGDVLNTASRIQAKCNELHTSLLVSTELLEQMDHEFPVKKVGAISLRGKSAQVMLSTIGSSRSNGPGAMPNQNNNP